MIAVIAIVAATLAAVAPTHAGYTSLGPELLTPDGATIPSGGGVLVGYAESHKDDHDREPTLQKAWRFRAGDQRLRPKILNLAPGLSAYVPPRAGTWALVDDNGETLGTFEVDRDAEAAALPAPELSDAVLASYTSRPDERHLDLATAPVAAVGMILYVVNGKRRTAIDWTMANAPARPARRPPGLRDPKVGERVEVRWFDAAGRRSPPSKVIAVRAAVGCELGDPCWPSSPQPRDPGAVGHSY